MGKRKPEHIRIEEGQVIGENLPEHRGGHVPETVTCLLPKCRFVVVFHILSEVSVYQSVQSHHGIGGSESVRLGIETVVQKPVY